MDFFWSLFFGPIDQYLKLSMLMFRKGGVVGFPIYKAEVTAFTYGGTLLAKQ